MCEVRTANALDCFADELGCAGSPEGLAGAVVEALDTKGDAVDAVVLHDLEAVGREREGVALHGEFAVGGEGEVGVNLAQEALEFADGEVGGGCHHRQR